jgi:bla regulator protein BlaR1
VIAELARHLWQSTFFGLAVAALTLAFRGNRAQVRYWLWLSASVKFLVPFVLLMSVGDAIETWAPVAHKIATPAVSFVEEYVGQPVPDPLPFAPSASRGTDWIPSILLGLWACGFLTIALMRFRSSLRIRAAVRASTPTEIHAAVEVRVSPGLLEPGVVGLLRPILLLPDGITERLTPSELKAVLAHELCHVRRRDNLFAAIHMIVETVFWFHPLVWWIGARLVEERERACDEEVLSQGNAADVYVDAILNVCKLYVESPLTCVAGVSGASIKRRIEAIMSNRIAIRLSIAQKTALAVAVALTLVMPVVVGILTAPAIRAQSAPTPRLKFEVASIRPCNPEDMPVRPGGGRNGGGGASGPADTELFRAVCAPVGRLIMTAYVQFADGHALPQGSLSSLKDSSIHGGPDWIYSDRYTIEAKPASPQTRGMMNGPMLQALLEDRFRLKIHRESKEVPVYALVLAKGGPRLQHSKEGGCTPGDPDGPPPPVVPGQPLPCSYMGGSEKGGVEAVGVPISSLFDILSPQLRRPIIDKTGLTGLFDYHFDAASGAPNSSPQLDDPAYQDTIDTITNALEKLGLKIQPAKGTTESVVVDHVERPSEN